MLMFRSFKMSDSLVEEVEVDKFEVVDGVEEEDIKDDDSEDEQVDETDEEVDEDEDDDDESEVGEVDDASFARFSASLIFEIKSDGEGIPFNQTKRCKCREPRPWASTVP